jgi:hypothetical protein
MNYSSASLLLYASGVGSSVLIHGPGVEYFISPPVGLEPTGIEYFSSSGLVTF